MGVQLRNIVKRFEDVTALGGVSVDVSDGEFVTLLGPSGCGKTTLLRVVAGFIAADEGEVWIDDENVNELPPNWRSTGMLFQSYALFPHMTVKDNVAFGPKMHRMPKKRTQERVAEALDLVEMRAFEQRYPAQLSGGQQQRVALARTLAVEPSVLLLDEPMAALDRKLRMQMRIDLKKMVDRVGITTIFVTHDQIEALTMSDKIAVMDAGQVMQYGTPTEIYDKPQTTFVADFIGQSNILKGQVEKDSEQRLRINTGDLQMTLPDRFREYLDQQVTLLLRPEHLSLRTESGNENQYTEVKGTVSFVTNTGTNEEYEIELESGRTISIERTRSREEQSIPEGSQVFVRPVDESSFWIVPGA